MFLNDASWWQQALQRPLGLSRLLGIVVALIFAPISRWLYKRKQEAALDWPSIEGSVQFATVSLIRDSTWYSVTLQYSYFVGEYRSGEYSQNFPTESDADDFAKAMKDKKVQVSYNPAKPEDSILDESSIPQQAMFSTRID